MSLATCTLGKLIPAPSYVPCYILLARSPSDAKITDLSMLTLQPLLFILVATKVLASPMAFTTLSLSVWPFLLDGMVST